MDRRTEAKKNDTTDEQRRKSDAVGGNVSEQVASDMIDQHQHQHNEHEHHQDDQTELNHER